MKNILLLVFTVLFGIAGVSQSLAADIRTISKEELKSKLGTYEYTILDVRTENQWEDSDNKIPGALRLPSEKIDIWAENFHKNTPIVLYCACDGLGTSGRVARRLMEKGFTHVYALIGGWKDWLMNSYPVAHK